MTNLATPAMPLVTTLQHDGPGAGTRHQPTVVAGGGGGGGGGHMPPGAGRGGAPSGCNSKLCNKKTNFDVKRINDVI